MKYNLELLKADVRDELAKLANLGKAFEEVGEKLALEPEEVSPYDRGAIGYMLHNFYNGCENIFQSIARFFENDVGRQAWHKDLLKRMRITVEGYRPAVINRELFVLLDDFRAFRHRFRHSYAFELDWEREREVAKKLPATLSMFTGQVETFLAALDGM